LTVPLGWIATASTPESLIPCNTAQMRPRIAVIPAVVVLGITGLTQVNLSAGHATQIAAPSTGHLTCFGKDSTIADHSGTVIGTPRNDVIVLTGQGRVRAGAGNDLICGSKEPDTISGGAGDDTIFGREGADVIKGGPGADEMFGDLGNDDLRGGPGADNVQGGPGSNVMLGGTGVDVTAATDVGISLIASQADISTLRSAGQSIVIATPAQPGAGGIVTVWGNLAPMMSNFIGLSANYEVFALANPPVASSVLPDMTGTTVTLGQSMTVNGARTFAASGTGAPGVVTVKGAGGLPGQQWVGLGQKGSVSGSPIVGPVGLSTVVANAATTLAPAGSALLFTASGLRSGSILGGAPQRAFSVPLKPGNTVQVMLYYGTFSIVG
jgi:hypothetical protein